METTMKITKKELKEALKDGKIIAFTRNQQLKPEIIDSITSFTNLRILSQGTGNFYLQQGNKKNQIIKFDDNYIFIAGKNQDLKFEIRPYWLSDQELDELFTILTEGLTQPAFTGIATRSGKTLEEKYREALRQQFQEKNINFNWFNKQ